MKRAFLTYQRSDQSFVESLKSALERPGLELVTDRTIAAGEDMAEAIGRELSTADAIIVVLSASSEKVNWVPSDVARYVRDPEKLVLPILLEGYRENPLFSVLGDRTGLLHERLGTEGVAAQISNALGLDASNEESALSIFVEGPDQVRFELGSVPGSTRIRDVARAVTEQYDAAWPANTSAVVDRVTSGGSRERLEPGETLTEASVSEGETLMVAPETIAGCFAEETSILMADSTTRPICDLTLGDEIAGSSQYLDGRYKAVVMEVVKVPSRRFIIINHRLKVTPSHRLLVNRKWSSAGELRLRDQLYRPDGSVAVVHSLAIEEAEAEAYNLIAAPSGGGFFADEILVQNPADSHTISALEALGNLQSTGILPDDSMQDALRALISAHKTGGV